MSNNYTIKCPKCGREYHPSEIFYPNSFLGRATDVARDNDGNILFFTGDDMCLNEEYTCDNCNTTFKVIASVDFKTSIDNEHSFDEEYSTPLYENRISLKES